MEEYSRLGHMDAVLDDEYKNTEHYFIPHFAVVREQSESTPLRVVFNASQATSTGVSLNDTLLGGPTIQDDLISILLRFRTYCYALVGDISKFFRQILIDSSQRNLQLIYWRETSDQPKQIYRLNTITYGMTSSPYLATRTLNQLYQDEGEQFPLAKSSQNNWYMDDYVGGGNDLQTVINMRREITSLLKLGGFPVKKWISNEEQILNTIPLQEKSSTVAYGFDDNSTVHTLGMIWRPKADQFSYAVNVGHSTITKRHILSDIASIFDPLGLIGPVLTTAKIIMQELWRDKLEWDQVVPLELQNKWIRFREDPK